jgi:hypothetical protein
MASERYERERYVQTTHPIRVWLDQLGEPANVTMGTLQVLLHRASEFNPALPCPDRTRQAYSDLDQFISDIPGIAELKEHAIQLEIGEHLRPEVVERLILKARSLSRGTSTIESIKGLKVAEAALLLAGRRSIKKNALPPRKVRLIQAFEGASSNCLHKLELAIRARHKLTNKETTNRRTDTDISELCQEGYLKMEGRGNYSRTDKPLA